MGTPEIRGINHVTFGVVDLEQALAFYRDVLGGRVDAVWDGGAYLRLGSLWVALLVARDRVPTGGRSHLALDVDRQGFATLAARIRASDAPLWRENQTEGESLYFTDPDGHHLELHVGDLESRLEAMGTEGGAGVRILDATD